MPYFVSEFDQTARYLLSEKKSGGYTCMSDRMARISPEAWYVSVVLILHYDFLNYQVSTILQSSGQRLIDYLREFTQGYRETFLLCAFHRCSSGRMYADHVPVQAAT
jgi:hypothetical protein